MTIATLRRSGGSLIMAIPPAFAEQNHLTAGDDVSLSVDGHLLTVQPLCKPARFDVAALLAETPEEYLSLPEWENQSGMAVICPMDVLGRYRAILPE